MTQLEASLKNVPTYHIFDQIRQEERVIAKDAVKSIQNKMKIEREQKEALIMALLEKQVSIDQIAKIMNTTPKIVEKFINKKK